MTQPTVHTVYRTPTIRAALQRLVDLSKQHAIASVWDGAFFEARAALAAKPVAHGPSEQGIAEMAKDLEWRRMPQAEGTGNSFLLDLSLAVLARWGHPAVLPAPEPGKAEAVDHQHYDYETASSSYTFPFTTLDEAREAARQLAGPNAEIVHRYLRQQHMKQQESQPTTQDPRPTAPPAPEVVELIQCLQIRAASLGAEGANLSQRGDAAYFTRAAVHLQRLSEPVPAVVPVAVEALTRLYWWGGMREDYGYDSNVVLGVRHWIDGGMVGSLPRLPAWVADRCPPLLQGGEGEA